MPFPCPYQCRKTNIVRMGFKIKEPREAALNASVSILFPGIWQEPTLQLFAPFIHHASISVYYLCLQYIFDPTGEATRTFSNCSFINFRYRKITHLGSIFYIFIFTFSWLHVTVGSRSIFPRCFQKKISNPLWWDLKCALQMRPCFVGQCEFGPGIWVPPSEDQRCYRYWIL